MTDASNSVSCYRSSPWHFVVAFSVEELDVVCDRFSRIQQRLSLDKTDPFVSRLHCYWTLKRRSRNGAPLLRSMLFSFSHLARQRLLVSA